MTRILRSLPALAALVLPARAAAQAYAGIDSQQQWSPPYPPAGAFAGLRAGSCDGDELPDAVVLDGTHAVFFRDPAQDHRYAVLSDDASALALWPAPPSRRDRILISETSRLVLARWSPEAADFVALDVLGGARATAARSLEVLVDAAGASWLGGLADDGRTLFAGTLASRDKTRTGAGAALPHAGYHEHARFTLAEDVLAWELLQWDGAGEPEFAVQTATGMQVHDALGAGLLGPPIPLVASLPLIERFPDAALGADRLYWVTGDGLGGLLGSVLDRRFPAVEPPMALGALELGQAGFADYDGDGWPDLWTSAQSLDQAFLLYRDPLAAFPASPTFVLDPARTSAFDLSGSSTATPTVASLGDAADFDLDGDTDFLFVSEDFGHLNFLRGDVLDQEQQVPVLYGFQFNEVINEPVHTFGFGLQLSIDPDTYPSAPALLGVEVFHQPTIGAQVDPEPRAVVQGPIEGSGLADVHVEFSVSGDPPEAVYQFRFRPLDAQGAQIGPASIHYYANSPVVYLQLATEGNAWNAPGLDDGDGGNGFHRRATIGPFCVTCN